MENSLLIPFKGISLFITTRVSRSLTTKMHIVPFQPLRVFLTRPGLRVPFSRECDAVQSVPLGTLHQAAKLTWRRDVSVHLQPLVECLWLAASVDAFVPWFRR